MIVTPALLQDATGCTPSAADLYAQPLAGACAFYGINTAPRLAAFLAQIGHESGSLRYVAEVWGPTDAQKRYEGRRDLGNVYPGDGEKFKGHGLLQVTGRGDHAAVRDRMREAFGDDVPDFERTPEALEQPRWACLSACDWWAHHGCNELADAGDIIGLGRLINRGSATTDRPANGEADRLQRWERAKAAIGNRQGLLDGSPAAAELPRIDDQAPAAPTSPISPKGDPMPSFSDVIRRPETAGLLSLVNPLLGLVPSIAKLFMDGDKTVPERNVAVAVAVADAAQKALADAGKPAENMQQVVETIAADPAARDIVRAGIIADCGHLVEAGGGGIEGARKANAETAAGPGFWLTPAFWITLLLMPLVYFTVYTVLSSERFSGEVQSMVIAAVVSGVLGSVTGFFLGSSFSSQRKDTQRGVSQ